MNMLIFDTETTGIENAELIEFGGLHFDVGYRSHNLSDQVLLIEKRFKMRPEQRILPVSTVIHGITQDRADEWESCSKVIPELHDFLTSNTDNKTIFVGQNINYDIDVLNSAFKKYGLSEINFNLTIDTRRLAKQFIPKDDIGGYSLDAIYYYLFPERLDKLFDKRSIHSAVTDCWLTYDVLMELKKRMDIDWLKTDYHTWEQLCEISAKPFDLSDETWPFGKHKGMKFKDTPSSYIKWCLTSEFKDDPKNADIIYTLKKNSIEIRS